MLKHLKETLGYLFGFSGVIVLFTTPILTVAMTTAKAVLTLSKTLSIYATLAASIEFLIIFGLGGICLSFALGLLAKVFQ